MDKITLRVFTDDDIPLMIEWLARPHVSRWYEHPQEWLREVSQRRGEFSFLTHKIALLGETPVGFCQYYDCFFSHEEEFPASEPGRVYSIDYLIGSEQDLRKGYGRQMIALMLSEIGPGKTVLVQPDAENAGSCGALLSCGFVFDDARQVYVKTTGLDVQLPVHS